MRILTFFFFLRWENTLHHRDGHHQWGKSKVFTGSCWSTNEWLDRGWARQEMPDTTVSPEWIQYNPPECIHCSPFPKRRCRSECLKTHPDCVGRVQTRQHEQSKPVKRTGGKLTHGKAQGEKGEKMSTSRWGGQLLSQLLGRSHLFVLKKVPWTGVTI